MAVDIAGAAYKAAMANVPVYDPNVTQIQAGLSKAFMDPIMEAIKTKDLENKAKNEEEKRLKDQSLEQFTTTADATKKE